MSHARQQIREKVRDVLIAVPALVDRVYTNPHMNFGADLLPVLVITTPLENDVGGMSTIERRMTLQVECVAASDRTADDLDDLCLLVEAAILTSVTLGGFITEISLVSIQTDFSRETGKLIGASRLHFEVLYSTAHGAPQTIR